MAPVREPGQPANSELREPCWGQSVPSASNGSRWTGSFVSAVWSLRTLGQRFPERRPLASRSFCVHLGRGSQSAVASLGEAESSEPFIPASRSTEMSVPAHVPQLLPWLVPGFLSASSNGSRWLGSFTPAGVEAALAESHVPLTPVCLSTAASESTLSDTSRPPKT